MLPSHLASRPLVASSRRHRRVTWVLVAAMVVVLTTPATVLAAPQSTVATDSLTTSATTKKKKKQKARRAVAKRAFVVGDSLGVGTAPYLRAELARWKLIQTHAISRHAPDGVEILRARKATGKRYGPIVVMQLGTNDDPRYVSSFRSNVKSVLAVAGTKRCVIWVNVVRPMVVGTTYDGYNAALVQLAAKRANLRVLDWVSLVSANPGWLSTDGVHVNGAGYEGRAAALAREIKGCRQYLRTA